MIALQQSMFGSLLQQRRAVPFTPFTKALPRRPYRSITRAEPEAGSSAAPPEAKQDDGDLLIEQQLLSKRRKPKEAKPSKAGGPQVVSPVRDQVYGGGPLSPEQQLENRVVQALALLFVAILGEGLFLGASGFMSEEVDQFAQDVVYPLFSPSIGLFLLVSSLYGLWKTYFQGQGPAKQ